MMTRIQLSLTAAIFSLLWLGLPGTAAAQEDDVFAFVPDGGRTLLESVREAGMPPSLGTAIAKNEGDPETWGQRLKEAKVEAPAIAELDNWQIDTLAHYLAANAPMNPTRDLPWDGRDMALKRCQFCHIITVVVTQEKTKDAWLGTMHRPSHIEIELTEPEREALADYLVLNASIPIDQVPPALRAGGATY